MAGPIKNKEPALKKRLNTIKVVRSVINKGPKTRCIKSNKMIGSTISVLGRIGSDSINADVYKARFPYKYKTELAIKLIPLSKMEKSLEKHDRESLQMLNRSLAWSEVYFLKLLSKLVTEKICPNLPIMYSYFTCNKCDIQNPEAKQYYSGSRDCILVITELADGDLKTLLQDYNYTYKQLLSIYFQIYAGIYAMRKYYNIWHQDLHWGNVLFHQIKPGGYFKYIIDGNSVLVPNYGILAVLWDLGYARIPGIIENDTLSKINAENTNEYEDYSRITAMASLKGNKISNRVYKDLMNIIIHFENLGIPDTQSEFLLTVGNLIEKRSGPTTAPLSIAGTFNMSKKIK
jgi:hypothetical protein